MAELQGAARNALTRPNTDREKFFVVESAVTWATLLIARITTDPIPDPVETAALKIARDLATTHPNDASALALRSQAEEHLNRRATIPDGPGAKRGWHDVRVRRQGETEWRTERMYGVVGGTTPAFRAGLEWMNRARKADPTYIVVSLYDIRNMNAPEGRYSQLGRIPREQYEPGIGCQVEYEFARASDALGRPAEARTWMGKIRAKLAKIPPDHLYRKLFLHWAEEWPRLAKAYPAPAKPAPVKTAPTRPAPRKPGKS